MGISVKLESPPGIPVNVLNFKSGETIRVKGVVTSIFGFTGKPWADLTVQMTLTGYYPVLQQLKADAGGTFVFNLDLPNDNTTGNINIIADTFMGREEENIPIVVGSTIPVTPYTPPDAPKLPNIPLLDIFGLGSSGIKVYLTLALVLGAAVLILKSRVPG